MSKSTHFVSNIETFCLSLSFFTHTKLVSLLLFLFN
eukprot:UN15027